MADDEDKSVVTFPKKPEPEDPKLAAIDEMMKEVARRSFEFITYIAQLRTAIDDKLGRSVEPEPQVTESMLIAQIRSLEKKLNQYPGR